MLAMDRKVNSFIYLLKKEKKLKLNNYILGIKMLNAKRDMQINVELLLNFGF